jgi:hypothetical protein
MRRNGQWDSERPNAKILTAPLKKGDAYALRSGGGGGFGSPLERRAEAVQDDVREGYVSLQAARDYYGVMLDAGTLAIDVKATENERTALGDVHRKRMENQKTPVRRLTAAELSDKPPEHPVMPCLRLSCCGGFLFAMDDEGRPVG